MNECVNTDNVYFLDEYPHLSEKVRLQRLSQAATTRCEVLVLPVGENEG